MSFPNAFSEVMRLIEAGAHSYAKNGLHGGGPLHQLIINTAPVDSQSTRFRSRTAELLLTNGLDPNLQDLSGRTALMLAARKGQMDLLQLLISWV